MARKISRRSKAAQDDARTVDELDVLHPERTVVVDGQRIVVREYAHLEWLRLLPVAAPLVASIADMLEVGREPTYEEALAVVAAHAEALLPLVAQACDVEARVVEALDPIDGELLLMTWWGVNGRFFATRALNRVAVARAERQVGLSAGAKSTPRSSPTDTTDGASANSPSAS